MKVVTVGTFDQPSDLNILEQIFASKELNCERIIIYLYTDRAKPNLNRNFETRLSLVYRKLIDMKVTKFYINDLDTSSLYFLCQYDMKHYKIVLGDFYKFEIEPTNLIYGIDLESAFKSPLKEASKEAEAS